MTATKSNAKATDAVQPMTKIVKGRRGRTAKVDPALVASLKKVPTDGTGFLRMESFAGTAKDSRGTVRARITSHWQSLHGKGAPRLSVEWDNETGTPQVYVNTK